MHSGLTTSGSREISVASRSSSRSDAHRPGHGVARSTVTASRETAPRKTKRPVRAPAASDGMRVAMLAPISWRVPPRHYGPWERVVSLVTEGLVERGVDVTLFATADSVTQAHLDAVCPRPLAEDSTLDAKVWESLHIANAFEKGGTFDIIHNHYDFLPLTYARLVTTPVVTTIHGFSSDRIKAVYRRYAVRVAYVSISEADRDPDLPYIATVYHGIDLSEFTPRDLPGRGLV